MKRIIASTVCVAVAVLPAHEVLAGGCHTVAYTPHHAVYVPQLVNQQLFFGAGYALQDEARLARALKPLQDEIRALRGEQQAGFGNLRATMLKVRGSGTFVIDGSVDVDPQPGPNPTPQPTPVDPIDPPSPVDAGDAPAFTPQVSAIIQAKCSRCHGEAGPQKSLTIGMNAQRASEVFLRTFSDSAKVRMPPDGSLTDAERESFFSWASSEVTKKKGQQ